jgi:hypothetical protein
VKDPKESGKSSISPLDKALTSTQSDSMNTLA